MYITNLCRKCAKYCLAYVSEKFIRSVYIHSLGFVHTVCVYVHVCIFFAV